MEQLRVVLAGMEPYALLRRGAEVAERQERRKAPRVPVAVAVRVTEASGEEWEMSSVDLSPFGMKVGSGGGVHAGAAATLTFTPPDGGSPIKVQSFSFGRTTTATRFTS